MKQRLSNKLCSVLQVIKDRQAQEPEDLVLLEILGNTLDPASLGLFLFCL